MSRQGSYQGYGAVQEYRDDPGTVYRDTPDSSLEDIFRQIATNISSINNGGNLIERVVKTIGSDRDNGQAGQRIHEISQETSKVVANTMKLLKQLGSKRLDRSGRLRMDKVNNEFKDCVQRFQTIQKKATDKAKTASHLERTKPAKPKSVWDDDDDHHQLVVDDDRRQQLLAQEQVIDDDLALIREREEQIRALEGDILDVNEIFRDLGAMINEQGEQIDTIEANVDKAYTDVEGGREQLQKAAIYQKKSRKKMCCLMVIFLVIVGVLAIILALTIKK